MNNNQVDNAKRTLLGYLAERQRAWRLGVSQPTPAPSPEEGTRQRVDDPPSRSSRLAPGPNPPGPEPMTKVRSDDASHFLRAETDESNGRLKMSASNEDPKPPPLDPRTGGRVDEGPALVRHTSDPRPTPPLPSPGTFVRTDG
jgi:hypothetical protein